MASLRGRLIAGLVATAAIGLLALGAITYFEQRSFLSARVDEQARAAPAAVDRALSDRNAPAGFSDPDRDGRNHGGPGGPGGAPPGPPYGTYGERREPDGTKETTVFGYVTAHPDLPAKVPIGRLFTVDGTSGRYRAYARADLDGATTIAAVPLRETDQTLNRLLVVLGLVIAGVLVILGCVAWAVVRVGLLPLDRMGHVAGAIAGGDLSHRVEPTDPRTEVGRLGIALNAMLDRLERAFAEREASQSRLRRFIADASHELRTPLASIRGYAELFRMGAVHDRAEIERAMRRVEEEAARMGVLVEDLLTLARLDQVPEVPHAELDLGPLARDAVHDARATAPDRRIELHGDREAQVVGDAYQLRQVLANLLRNALVHTPEGTPVEVTVTSRDGEARVEVRDHGPGLPAGDSDALFERFWRAEGGRERGRGGAGLGLAIVAGIVDAHGGRVHAANAVGGGASFVVELPAARSQAALSRL
jgi:two-component system, OmpR family, sensor kinase